MPSQPRFVDLHVTRTPFETRVVAEVLREAGIPAQVNGELLADEVAVSQRLMNLQGVTIQVPEAMVAAAQEAIAAARSAGRELERELATQPEPPAPPVPTLRLRWVGIAVLSLAVVGVGALWVSAEVALAQARRQPLTDTEWQGNGWVAHWRDTRAIAGEWLDQDRNGIPEQTTTFNRTGEKLTRHFDQDQNGICERFEVYRRDGTLASRGEDADQDGRFELVQEHSPDGLRMDWRDVDRDPTLLERVEIRGASDQLLTVQERRGPLGFVPAK